jgi:dTDP-glucose 4,6-dehydratase
VTRVLISGAGGFAGAHCLEHILVNTDWDVVATDSFRHKGKTDRIREVLEGTEHWARTENWKQRTAVFIHDLRAPFSKQALAAIGDIDYIVAYASESHVDRSISDPVPFVRNNVDIALNTLELAREIKPKALVLVSTDEVCGPVNADDLTGHSEWGPMLPSNPYAGSKAAQEAIATSYWRTYGVPLVIVRCMNMVGERQDPEKFVPMTIAKVLRGEEVTIHGSPGNIGTRHYLHSRNLADGILYLLRNTTPSIFPAHLPEVMPNVLGGKGGYRPDMYNVASPDRIDNLTLAQMIAEYAGKPLRYRLEDFHTTRPGHDPHYGLDPSKLTNLGWTIPVPFGESLKKTVEWTIKNPHWQIPD